MKQHYSYYLHMKLTIHTLRIYLNDLLICYANQYQVLHINMKYGMWLSAHINCHVIGN